MKTVAEKYIIETCKWMTPLGERIRGIKVFEMLQSGERGKMIEQHIFDGDRMPVESKIFTVELWEDFKREHTRAAYSYNSTMP